MAPQEQPLGVTLEQPLRITASVIHQEQGRSRPRAARVLSGGRAPGTVFGSNFF